MIKILLVGLGGFFGAIARYAVSRASLYMFGSKFPYGTLLVNISGSFFLGCILGTYFLKNMNGDYLKLLVGTGFLGAFTTFSAFSIETIYLFEEGRHIAGAANVFGNLFLSLSAALLGMMLVRQ